MDKYKWFPWSDLLLVVVVICCFVLIGCARDPAPTPVAAAHTYEMVCYNEPALPGGDLFVMRRTIEADLCSVEGGPASGGFTVLCYEDRIALYSLHSAYLCISFEEVR